MRTSVCMLLLCCGCAASVSTSTGASTRPQTTPNATAGCEREPAGCKAQPKPAKAAQAPVRTQSFVLARPAGDKALKARLQDMGEAEVRRCWEADPTASGEVKLRVATTMTESEMGVTLAVTTPDEAMKRCLKAGARVWVFRMGAMDATGTFAYGSP